MSILHGFPLANFAPVGSSPLTVLFLLSLISVAAGVLIRAIPPRHLPGPDRVPEERSVWPLTAVLFGGAGVWLFSISVISRLQPNAGAGGITAEPPATVAMLSTIPPAIGFLALLLGDRIVHPASGQRIGITLRRLPDGLVRGLFCGLIVLPPLYLLMQIVEGLYRVFHYQHPAEHQLLHVLGQGPPAAVRAAIIAGACFVAPLFEELLFRGHVQTCIKRLARTLAGGRPSRATGRATSWIAILVTSVLFMTMHATWSWPIIFTLAVCLGYAYERTGNLWIAIVIHAVFNSVSTILFLHQMTG